MTALLAFSLLQAASAALAALPTETPTPTPIPPPVLAPRGVASGITGDCNGDREVTIDELVTGVNIALGSRPVSACPPFDKNRDGEVTIDELVAAVNVALNGPPPTPTRTVTHTPGTTGLTVIERSSPSQGESGVALTRETILTFSAALDGGSVTGQAVRAEYAGAALAARLHVSMDRRTVSLFYQEPLPAGARVRVLVDGDRLRDGRGTAIDADGNGTAGGLAVIEFDTSVLDMVEGTSVVGRVFASQLAQGDASMSVNVPLEGVTIAVEGAEHFFTLSDRFGNFRLDPAPAGRFFVLIDGTTAREGVPDGAFYPFVGKLWESVAGRETNVGEIYLPLIAAGTLQPVSRTEDTVIGFPPSVLSDFPQFSDVRITVPANSLFTDFGGRGGSVGIAPVPPDRLPAPLPPGLDFPVVITVQTSGPGNFDVPVPACFPNLPDAETGAILPAGSKSALWSFNHDTGRFEIVGPMTVSNDGRLVCTDAGVGIVAPGWHGTQPGVAGNGGEIRGSDDPTCAPGDTMCDPCMKARQRGAAPPPDCRPCTNDGACEQCEACQGGFCRPLLIPKPCDLDGMRCTKDMCADGTCKAGPKEEDCNECANAITGPAEVAVNQPVAFSIGGSTAGRTFNWSSGGVPASTPNSTTYNVLFANPGPFTVTADGGSDCVLRKNIVVTEDCRVSATGPARLTFGETATYSASGSPVPGAYEWRTEPPSIRGGSSEFSLRATDLLFRAVVTYRPEGQAMASCEAAVTTEVEPRFEHTINGRGAVVPDTKVFRGDLVQFFAEVEPGGRNYRFRWATQPLASPATSLNRDFATRFQETGFYQVTASLIYDGANGVRTISRTYRIDVVERDPCDVTVMGQTNVRVGESVNLTVTATPPGGSFSWTAANGTPSSGTGPNFQTKFNRSGTFPVVATYTLPAPDGRRCSRTVNVRVSSPPPPCSVTIEGPEFVEAGTTAQFSASVVPGPTQIVWSGTDRPETTAALAPDAPFEHSFESPGEYRVEALAILGNGASCRNSMKVVVFTRGANP